MSVNLFSIIAAILLGAPAFALGQNCTLQGQCQKSFLLRETSAPTEQDCLIECKTNSDCKWYSFNPTFLLCKLFSECNELTSDNCKGCVSGEARCADLNCGLQGVCEV